MIGALLPGEELVHGVLHLVLDRDRQILGRDVVSAQEDVGQLALALALDGLDLLELGFREVSGLDQRP